MRPAQAGVRNVSRRPLAQLAIRPELVPADPIGRLPITMLSRNVIEPLFGIKDPRIDKRIDFVGGARGLEGLEKRVSIPARWRSPSRSIRRRCTT